MSDIKESFLIVLILLSGVFTYADNNYILVNPTPIITITPGSPAICIGSNIILTASGASTYSWIPVSTLSSDTGIAVTAAPTVTTTYTVTGTDINGNTNTNTVTVTVNPRPIMSVSSAGTLTICNGSNINLTASGASTYSWTPSATLSSGTGETVTATPASTTTYIIIGTDVNGCSNRLTVTVTVNPNQSAVFSYPGTTFCQSGTNPAPIFTGDGTPGNFGSTEGLVFVNVNSGVIDLYSSTPGTYTVTNTIAGGCFSSSFASTIIILPKPVLTVNSVSICEGNIASLFASGANSYQWSTGENTSVIVVSPISSTTYTVTGIISGCISTAISSVTVSPMPIINVNANVNLNLGNSTQLFATGGITYHWTPAAGLSCTDCPNPIASPGATTTYCVEAFNGIDCSDRAFVTVTVYEIKCDDIFVPNAFSPNGDEMNELECIMGSCISNMEFVIYDRWGEKIFESTDPINCWDGTYRGKPMNTAGFVYFFKATLITGEKISKKGNVNLIR